MAIIYRVETPEGFGPYSKIAPRLTDHENHHNPKKEGIEFPYYWYFGFQDLSLLTLWFSGRELEELKSYGQSWLLSKYEVPEDRLVSSSYQTAFDRRKATLLGCQPLDALAGAARERLSEEKVVELSAGFVPHESCEPRPRFGLFRETPLLTLDRGEHSLREVIDSLEDGRYYSATTTPEESDGAKSYGVRYFLFRNGSLYPLREAEFRPLSVKSALADAVSLRTFGA